MSLPSGNAAINIRNLAYLQSLGPNGKLDPEKLAEAIDDIQTAFSALNSKINGIQSTPAPSVATPAAAAPSFVVVNSGGGGSTPSPPVGNTLRLQVDGTDTGDQDLLNLVAGPGVLIADDGFGDISFTNGAVVVPSFTTLFHDPFSTDADQNPLDPAKWSEISTFFGLSVGPLEVASNKCQGTITGADNIQAWVGVGPSNCFAQFTLAAAPANTSSVPFMAYRYDSSRESGYGYVASVNYQFGNWTMLIGRIVNGIVNNFVSATIAATLNPGDVFAVACLGNTHYLFYNGVLYAAETDGTFDFVFSGSGSILLGAAPASAVTDIQFSDFKCGSAAGATPSIPTISAVYNSNATQGSAISGQQLYRVPLGLGGFYRISWRAKVTRAATSSSTLGGTSGFQITYTDVTDAVSLTPLAVPNADGTGNTTATQLSGAVVVNAEQGTNITFSFDYTSSGATGMEYQIGVYAEYLP
jgi:hypothetical protein